MELTVFHFRPKHISNFLSIGGETSLDRCDVHSFSIICPILMNFLYFAFDNIDPYAI